MVYGYALVTYSQLSPKIYIAGGHCFQDSVSQNKVGQLYHTVETLVRCLIWQFGEFGKDYKIKYLPIPTENHFTKFLKLAKVMYYMVSSRKLVSRTKISHVQYNNILLDRYLI